MDRLREFPEREQTISRLVKEYQSLSGDIDRHKKNRRDIELDLQRLQEKIVAAEAVPDTTALRDKIKLARKAGDLDRQCRELAAALADKKRHAGQAVSALTLWHGEPQAALTLAVPQRDTIKRFEKDFAGLAQKQQILTENQWQISQEIEQTETSVRLVKQGITLPSEQQLQETRAERDQAWSLIRQSWLDGRDVSEQAGQLDPARPLPQAFEERLSLADRIADQLRREAGEVTRLEQLDGSLKVSQRKLDECAIEVDACEQQRLQLQTEWQALWAISGIEPLPPAEMSVWLEDLEKVRRLAEDVESLQSQLALQERQRAGLIESLTDALPERQGDSETLLEPLLLSAESRLEKLDSAARTLATMQSRLDEFSDRLHKVTVELSEAEAAEKQWSKAWQEAVAGSGLDEYHDPGQAMQQLAQIVQAFERRDDLLDLRTRVVVLEQDLAAFGQLHGKLAETLPPGEAGQSTEQQLEAWHKALALQQARLLQREQFRKDLDGYQTQLSSLQGAFKLAESTLQALLKEARTNDPQALDGIEKRAAELAGLRERLVRCETDILNEGGGEDLA
ncbi:MAG: hypothetical protein KDJ38_08755, partial [Gammaproteobacteria bacterium]|nr:hypothetical protein [Gammaproteobacteria bacterium]